MNNQLIVDVIGWVAAVVGTVIMVPQVIRSFKTKRTKDISIAMVLIFILNCSLWTTYGFLIKSRQLVVSNGIVLGLLGLQLYAKTKYDKLE